MTPEAGHGLGESRDDSGLIAYATILALHRIAVDPNLKPKLERIERRRLGAECPRLDSAAAICWCSSV